ncbi:MAG: lytic transglycosylase domain-containing protein [Micavibrio sp.]|nr:lytic transglycosylase domain-containing protein [Micavibrio sp.]
MQSRAAQELTVRALQSMNQGRWDVARQMVANSRDPLATKLYHWMIFSKRNEIQDYARMVQMIRTNPEWPGISAMKQKAEGKMPMSLRYSEIIAWFNDYPPITASGLERYIDALLGTGRNDKARKVLGDWWASSTLSRNSQRNLYRKYKSMITLRDHGRRFDSMLYKGQYENARAIAGILGPGYPELAEARIALATDSGNADALISRVPQNLQGDAGLLYERLRWRRKHDMDVGAMEILHKQPATDKIQNLPEWWKERHIIIRRLIEKKHWKSAYLLASGHKQTDGFSFAQAEWLAGWLALRFMNNDVAAYKHFDRLYRNVKTPVSLSRGAYWAGRASERFQDKTVSSRWYQIAAQYQTVFYGQLAAEKLGLTGDISNHAPPKLSAQDNAAFAAKEMMQAARLFHRAGMKNETSRFMRAFVEHENSDKAYFYAANEALRLNMLYDAVRISKTATQKGMFLTAQSYPVITERLRGVTLEWSLVHAIIRQESMFDEDARSPAGALGLMQLMPGTAKEVAGKMGVGYSPSRLTNDPSYNILLGSRYLSDLVDRLDGSYPIAIASYNAGPGRVRRWLDIIGDPRDRGVDLIDWIEVIPVYETRNYVQRVLENTYVYRLRLMSQQKTPSTPLHVANMDIKKR